MIRKNFKTMKFTLVITQIILKTIGVLGVPLCALMILQAFIHIQPTLIHIVMYGIMVRKFGATLKVGTCTLLRTGLT